MKGVEMLEQITANPYLSSLPVILYSGNVTDDLRIQAMKAGAYAVLTKPYKLADLVDIITRVLRTQ